MGPTRVAVMYGGRIVETGTTAEVFERPRHPYTMALLSARPRFRGTASREVIAGSPSAVPAEGCRFRPRCRYAIDVCATEDPPLTTAAGTHAVACHVQPRGDESGRLLSVAGSTQ